LVTDTNGVVSRVVVTQSVIVTTTKPATSTSTTRPVTSTAPIKPVSGTLPIPASGTYTVARGDTLIAIARRFGITPWWRLAELNDLQEPFKIEVGQVLKLR
jgi:LysM repeat protein